MFEILVAAIVGHITIVWLISLFVKPSANGILLSTFYMLFLWALAAANFEFAFFEQKVSSTFAYDVYVGRASTADNSGFFLQYLLNIPAFLLTNAWWAATGTNIAVMSGIFYFTYLKKPSLAPLLLAPAILNFSMFSVRDPIICALFFWIAVLQMEPHKPFQLVKQGVLAAVFLLIRPENILIVALWKLSTLIDWTRHRSLAIVLAPLLLVVCWGALSFAPRLLGVGDVYRGGLSSQASEFYEARATRHSGGERGKSDILGGSLVNLPLPLRYPIQIFTFFVLPLPFEINSMAMGLAFLDSIVFCFLTWRLCKTRNRYAIALLAVYVLAVAFFSGNYGNVFRIRAPAYFIIIGGLISYHSLKERIVERVEASDEDPTSDFSSYQPSVAST